MKDADGSERFDSISMLRQAYASYRPSQEILFANISEPYLPGYLDYLKDDPDFVKQELLKIYPAVSQRMTLKTRVAYAAEYCREAVAGVILRQAEKGAGSIDDLAYFHDVFYGAVLSFEALFFGEDERTNEGNELTRALGREGEASMSSFAQSLGMRDVFKQVARELDEDPTGKSVIRGIAGMIILKPEELPAHVIPQYAQSGALFAADAYSIVYDYTQDLIEGLS